MLISFLKTPCLKAAKDSEIRRTIPLVGIHIFLITIAPSLSLSVLEGNQRVEHKRVAISRRVPKLICEICIQLSLNMMSDLVVPSRPWHSLEKSYFLWTVQFEPSSIIITCGTPHDQKVLRGLKG